MKCIICGSELHVEHGTYMTEYLYAFCQDNIDDHAYEESYDDKGILDIVQINISYKNKLYNILVDYKLNQIEVKEFPPSIKGIALCPNIFSSDYVKSFSNVNDINHFLDRLFLLTVMD
jgi:hypothetical protein